MKVADKLNLDDHPWLTAKPLARLLDILNSDGIMARMVGGCVRDTLLGRDIMDIDIACSLTPEAVIQRLEQAKVKVIPTGLKHGTITALIDKNPYEITTLRRDVATDGRHATVAFTDDWLADAKRRDFTFNALYLDGDGSLYDPCDGLEDLKARRVRFIGDASLRIQEDALRILRFFRFAAQIGRGRLDPDGFEACIRNIDLIDILSGERLAQEISKILKAENIIIITKVMADHGFLDKVLPDHVGLEKLTSFVRLEKELGRCDALARLSCLLPKNSQAVAKVSHHLKLSNHQSKILNRFAEAQVTGTPEMSVKDLHQALYGAGRDVVVFAILHSWAHSNLGAEDREYNILLSNAENWPLPTFPVQGRDLINAGIDAGPELGRILKQLEQDWVDSDFTRSSKELLETARTLKT